MSLQNRSLRGLLQLFFSTDRQRTRLLRADIRSDLHRQSGRGRLDGQDFYVAFWADCKAHIAKGGDLHAMTARRIAAHPGRARLYALLRDAFLFVLRERLSWQNEPISIVPESLSGHFQLDELDMRVRVENLIYARTSAGIDRIVYPYFNEEPALPIEGARLGLWAMMQAFPSLPVDEFRIFDILRRSYFSVEGIGLIGDERKIFVQKFRELSDRRSALRSEYD